LNAIIIIINHHQLLVFWPFAGAWGAGEVLPRLRSAFVV